MTHSSVAPRLRDLQGRRVVIWGAGVEGRAAEALLCRHAPPSSLTVVTDNDPKHRDAAVAEAEVIVKSPGVSLYKPELRAAAAGRTLTGGSALWFAETHGNNTIAVTGSKGKSTTSSLIAHLFGSLNGDAGVAFAGNVGRALLDLLDEDLSAGGTPPDRWNVLELSSFQTAELRHSPVIGVLTALFPEHLDWHGSVDRYYADKCNLFAHRPDITTVANADNPGVAARMRDLPNVVAYGVPGGLHVVGHRSDDGVKHGALADGALVDGSIVDGTRELLPLVHSPLLGRHNHINLCGALAALRVAGFDLHAEARSGRLYDAVSSFRPLPHRLERLGDIGGRLVVDDGLSTAPDAAIAALAAFADRPVSIIVGGHDRNLDYTNLADTIAQRVAPTSVLGVPESGARITELVAAKVQAIGNAAVSVACFIDFDDAVHRALDATPIGGVILLSPGAPSFGRFANYAERSAHFRTLVGLA